jgi:hypothetical protein
MNVENYGLILRDHAANSRTAKAYYHADLERADEALDVCPHGEGVVDVAGFWTLRGCAEKRREETRQKEEGRRERDT